MSQIIIGVFSNASQAEDAKSYLLSNGFSTENINIIANTSNESISDRITDYEVVSKNVTNSVDNEDANTLIAAGQKSVIVSVQTQNLDEALEASEVLINYGALNVNDQIG